MESITEALISRGWCFRSPEEIRHVIARAEASSSEGRSRGTKSEMVDLVETDMLNMDLRSFGERSLPDASTLKKSSHLQGPKVLQVVSARDIYQSGMDASFRNSQHNRRLLRFVLTDGNSEVTAIEYTPIPAIMKEIIPGMKVRLENRVAMQNGILCLDPKGVTILGGQVQNLFEEWQLDQKYSSLSHATLKSLHNNKGVGPPPFEKLQLEGCSHFVSLESSSSRSQSGLPDSDSKGSLPLHFRGNQGTGNKSCQSNEKGTYSNNSASNDVDDNNEMALASKKKEGNTSTSDARPKEVVEAMPVQNQAASQKLLQKMSQPDHEDGCCYGRNRHRGKGKQEEAPVFTLDEWEKRKNGPSKLISAGEKLDISHDEELARQIQRQLDLEDSHVHKGQQTEAERIRMSMFSFERAEERNNGIRGSRGRGRGRGRGRRFG